MKFAYIFITIGAILALWFSRLVWLQPPDHAYVRDLFDHSQWRFPLSTRIISDEQLYQHAGQYLVTTGDLFTVNPEVPPLAKYLYGWSFQFLGNPYTITPIFLGLSLLFYYGVARQLKLSRETALWMTGIILITPLVFGQLTQTMLDLPQLLWLLAHIYFILQLKQQSRPTAQVFQAVLAGLFLGAFAATKVPLLVPALVVADAFYLWRIRKIWLLAVIGCSSAALYISSYLPYFAAGHSLREWLGTQKWMLEFYRQGKVEAHPLLFPISVLTGWYQGWWDQPWQRIVEWSLIWPISVGAPFLLLYRWVVKKKPMSWELQYLTILSLLLIGIHLIIPFWPRYFLLLLPLCLLGWPHLFQEFSLKLRPWVKAIGVIFLIGQAVWFGRPSPYQTLNLAIEQWEKGHYQDLYQSISPATRPTASAEEYHRTMKKVEYTLGQPTIEWDAPRTWPWQSSVPVNATLIYETPLGQVRHQSSFQAVRVGSRWAVEWNWAAVLPTFKPTDSIVFVPKYPRLGTLSTADGIKVSEAGLIPTLSVIPMEVEAEPTLKEVAVVTNSQFNNLVAQVYVNSVNDWVTPIGKVDPYSEVIESLKRRPGVVLTEIPGRVLHPGLVTADARRWAQSKADEYSMVDGQLGGSIQLTRADGEPYVLIERPAVDGTDVVLPEPVHPAFTSQYGVQSR